MHFLEPAPHMALAKYYKDHDNRLLAFYILETARRTRFEEAIFNRAFQMTFGGFDNSTAAEAALLKDLAGQPEAEEVIFKLADLYISRSDWPRAKQYLSLGIKIHPDVFKFTSGFAEVLRIEGNIREADRLIKEYLDKYPQSVQAYAMRAEKLNEAEPAKAKSILLEAREKFPASSGIRFDLGKVLQQEGKLAEAEESFVKAAELSPESSVIQAWVGRFFYKVRNDKVRALEYYLNAYLLDPDAYESEFVESRISRINGELAEAEFEKQTKAGVPVTTMLEDSNPEVISIALDQLAKNWKSAYLEAVLKCMEHDYGGVRWQATEAIKNNTDGMFDEKLKALLTDSDLRKRGLAAYLAVHRWKKESFGVIRNMLAAESQLLRFDALSALILEGGVEGRKLALEHAANERNPTLKKLVESLRDKETPGPQKIKRRASSK